MKTWVKSVPGRGTSMCKSPEAEVNLLCSRTRKEASLPGHSGKWWSMRAVVCHDLRKVPWAIVLKLDRGQELRH